MPRLASPPADYELGQKNARTARRLAPPRLPLLHHSTLPSPLTSSPASSRAAVGAIATAAVSPSATVAPGAP